MLILFLPWQNAANQRRGLSSVAFAKADEGENKPSPSVLPRNALINRFLKPAFRVL